MITKLIADIEKATNLKVYAEVTNAVEECIVYSFYKVTDNGAVAQYRLALTILTNTLAKSFNIKEIIDNLLITKGDEQKYDEIINCDLGGGGGFVGDTSSSLYTKEISLYEAINYYDITCKSNVDWR